MDIIISNLINKPIYEQIKNQIKDHIISGTLFEGDALPSMRFLAKELRVSVITTKRAYEELEKEGFIVSFTGKGSFVAAKNVELILENNLRDIEEHIEKICKLSKQGSIEFAQLVEMLKTIYEGE